MWTSGSYGQLERDQWLFVEVDLWEMWDDGDPQEGAWPEELAGCQQEMEDLWMSVSVDRGRSGHSFLVCCIGWWRTTLDFMVVWRKASSTTSSVLHVCATTLWEVPLSGLWNHLTDLYSVPQEQDLKDVPRLLERWLQGLMARLQATTSSRLAGIRATPLRMSTRWTSPTCSSVWMRRARVRPIVQVWRDFSHTVSREGTMRLASQLPTWWWILRRKKMACWCIWIRDATARAMVRNGWRSTRRWVVTYQNGLQGWCVRWRELVEPSMHWASGNSMLVWRPWKGTRCLVNWVLRKLRIPALLCFFLYRPRRLWGWCWISLTWWLPHRYWDVPSKPSVGRTSWLASNFTLEISWMMAPQFRLDWWLRMRNPRWLSRWRKSRRKEKPGKDSAEEKEKVRRGHHGDRDRHSWEEIRLAHRQEADFDKTRVLPERQRLQSLRRSSFRFWLKMSFGKQRALRRMKKKKDPKQETLWQQGRRLERFYKVKETMVMMTSSTTRRSMRRWGWIKSTSRRSSDGEVLWMRTHHRLQKSTRRMISGKWRILFWSVITLRRERSFSLQMTRCRNCPSTSRGSENGGLPTWSLWEPVQKSCTRTTGWQERIHRRNQVPVGLDLRSSSWSPSRRNWRWQRSHGRMETRRSSHVDRRRGSHRMSWRWKTRTTRCGAPWESKGLECRRDGRLSWRSSLDVLFWRLYSNLKAMNVARLWISWMDGTCTIHNIAVGLRRPFAGRDPTWSATPSCVDLGALGRGWVTTRRRWTRREECGSPCSSGCTRWSRNIKNEEEYRWWRTHGRQKHGTRQRYWGFSSWTSTTSEWTCARLVWWIERARNHTRRWRV